MMVQTKYDIDFWKKFDKSKVTMEPSDFAKFCIQYFKKGQTLLDICGGNGRDSKYFTEKKLKVTSFDHETLNLEDKKPKFNLGKTFDNVYCRFVLHCVPEHLEDYILINAQKVLKDEGLLCIEVRSNKGKVAVDDHYRRLADLTELKQKLTKLNFEIIFERETDKLSVYNNENPLLIRLVAKKSGDIKTRGTRIDEKRTYCPLNPVYSYHLLFTVKQILDDFNIPFFLVFGTLLGAYRDKSFIKHDSDVDLGLLVEYRDKVQWLIDEGYFAIRGFLFIREWHGKQHLKALQYKTDYLDFWFFKKDGELYKSGKNYTIKAHQIDDGLSTIQFYGEEFKTVNNIEMFLERHYPEGHWKKPIKDYHAKM